MRRGLVGLVSVAFFGGLIGKGLRYSLNIVIARSLGIESLGIFAFLLAVVKVGSVVSRGGLDFAMQKYLPIYKGEEEWPLISSTTLIGLITPLLLGIVCAIAIFVFKDTLRSAVSPELGDYIWFYAFGIPLFSSMMVGIAGTKAFKESKYSVYARDIGQSSVLVLFALVGGYVLSDFTVVAYGYIFSLIVGLLLSVYFLFRLGAFKRPPTTSVDVREIFAYSAPLMFVTITRQILSWTDTLMLGKFETAAAIGLYHASFQTSLLLLLVLQSSNSIFPSIASDLYYNGELQRLELLYKSISKWIAYFTGIGFVLVLLFTSEILTLFGTDDASAEFALIILSFGQLVVATSGPVGSLLNMSGYERLQFINVCVITILNIFLNYILIQRIGLLGAAIASATSFALLNIGQIIELKALLGIQPFDTSYWKGIVALSIVTLVVFGIKSTFPSGPLLLPLYGGLSLIIFATLIYLLGIEESDKILLDSID
jgi:O-antigen/teichoic acid export membrane protein